MEEPFVKTEIRKDENIVYKRTAFSLSTDH